MFSCMRYRRHLGAFLDGETSRRENEAIAGHLEKCAACRAVLRELRELGSALHVLETPAPPSDLISRISAAARTRLQTDGNSPEDARFSHGLLPSGTWAFRVVSTAALLIGLSLGTLMGWTIFRDGVPAGSSTATVLQEPADGSLYALDALGAAPHGSIEAAALAIMEDDR